MAAYPDDPTVEKLSALGRVPIWAFHGDADSIVPKRYIVDPLTDLAQTHRR